MQAEGQGLLDKQTPLETENEALKKKCKEKDDDKIAKEKTSAETEARLRSEIAQLQQGDTEWRDKASAQYYEDLGVIMQELKTRENER